MNYSFELELNYPTTYYIKYEEKYRYININYFL